MTAYLIVAAVLTLSGCRHAVQQAATPEPYAGFRQDVSVLRDTAQASTADPSIRGSSAKASQAARRVFTQVEFTGKTKTEVLDLLGDPKTISSYGVAAAPGGHTPLVYRFDSGYGGWEYTLHFTNGVVTRVEEQSLD